MLPQWKVSRNSKKERSDKRNNYIHLSWCVVTKLRKIPSTEDCVWVTCPWQAMTVLLGVRDNVELTSGSSSGKTSYFLASSSMSLSFAIISHIESWLWGPHGGARTKLGKLCKKPNLPPPAKIHLCLRLGLIVAREAAHQAIKADPPTLWIREVTKRHSRFGLKQTSEPPLWGEALGTLRRSCINHGQKNIFQLMLEQRSQTNCRCKCSILPKCFKKQQMFL